MSVKEDVVARISSLPTVPIMASRLVHALNNPDAASAEICRIIGFDPALTANILKAANSSYLGCTKPVTSLAEAMFRLGTKWVFQIAISSLIYTNLKRPAPGYGMSPEEVWQHSMAVAIMSESLCDLLNIRDIGTIYTAALLHDIGKIALGEFVSDAFPALQERVNAGQVSFEEAELTILGVDHAEIGALIANSWHFPETIADCIRWHHHPDKAPATSPMIDLVHVADSICLLEGFGVGRDGLNYRLHEPSIERLSLSPDAIELAISQTIVALDDINATFKDLPAVPVRR